MMDDILVFGQTEKEYDDSFEEVLQRLRKVGMTLNKKKCVFRVREIAFFGHSISREGIRPDPDKIMAIREMKRPTNQN